MTTTEFNNKRQKAINKNLLIKKINKMNEDEIIKYIDNKTNRIILVDYKNKKIYYMNDQITPTTDFTKIELSSYADEIKLFTDSMLKKWFTSNRYTNISRFSDGIYAENNNRYDKIDNDITTNSINKLDDEYKEVNIFERETMDEIYDLKYNK